MKVEKTVLIKILAFAACTLVFLSAPQAKASSFGYGSSSYNYNSYKVPSYNSYTPKTYTPSYKYNYSTPSYQPYTPTIKTYTPSYNVNSYTNPSITSVNGYTKSNGTYMNSYFRTVKDNVKWNNFSSWGNLNPFTGKIGKIKW